MVKYQDIDQDIDRSRRPNKLESTIDFFFLVAKQFKKRVWFCYEHCIYLSQLLLELETTTKEGRQNY